MYLLDQHPSVAERGFRLPDGAFERGVEFDMRVDAAHSAPAPASDRLDQHRIADLIGLFAQEFRVLVVAMITGHDRHAGALHQRLGRAFQPHDPHRQGRRADKDDAGLRTPFGKIGVFGQKSVARMQTFGADFLRQRDNAGLIEIAVRALADLIGFVGKASEKRPAVDRRMHRDRAHSHAPRGANDAAGDLAAIGDEDIGEHVEAPTALSVPNPCSDGERDAQSTAGNNNRFGGFFSGEARTPALPRATWPRRARSAFADQGRCALTSISVQSYPRAQFARGILARSRAKGGV